MPERTSSGLSDPESWVDRHGDVLFRYALARVGHPGLAEDMVQETLLAALRQPDRFAGRSSERTWMIGILKHKILDHFRHAIRETPLEADPLAGDQGFSPFRHDSRLPGLWKSGARPAGWGIDGSDAVERAEFRQALDRCLQALDRRFRAVFVLREMEEMPTPDICNSLDISPTNLRVMMHRARLRLRACLEKSWLGGSGGRR